jgi:hypothetical protein
MLLLATLCVLAVLSLLATLFAPPRFAAFSQIVLALALVPSSVLAFLDRSFLAVVPAVLAATVAMLAARFRLRHFDRNLGVAVELLPGAVAFAVVWFFPRMALVAVLVVVAIVAWRELRVLPGRALAGPELTLLGGALLAHLLRDEPDARAILLRVLLGAVLAGAIMAAIAAAVAAGAAPPPGRAGVLGAAAALGGAAVASTAPVAVAILALVAYLVCGLSAGFAGAHAWQRAGRTTP